MRILHTADLHLGKLLEGRPRADEQSDVLDEIVAAAENEDVDLILIAGDVFDVYNPSAEAERLFFAFLNKAADEGRRAVVVVAGNHDQPQRLAAATPLAEAKSIYLLGSPLELPPVQDFDPKQARLIKTGCHSLKISLPKAGQAAVIVALPYLSEGRLHELIAHELSDEDLTGVDYENRIAEILKRAAADFAPDTVNLVLAHLFLRGGQESGSERKLVSAAAEQAGEASVGGGPAVGGSYGVDANVFPDTAQYVALGHLHRAQHVKAAAPCVYAGSPLAYSFSESNQVKSVVIIDAEPGEPVSWRRLPLAAGYPLSAINAPSYEEALRWCLDPSHENRWLKMILDCDGPLSAKQISELRAAHPRLLEIVVRQPRAQTNDARREMERLSDAEKFRVFAASELGREPEEDLMQMMRQLLEDRGDEEDETD